jgi:prepilin-type processing-associated H-X9-DG protein
MNRARIGTLCKFAGVACALMTLILVVFLLSGSFESERKPQRITCINNLKQIGIAFRIWEGDHGDQYPFNVSTNADDTMEFCAVGKDGFDSNAVFHLKAMANSEGMTSPKILVCPQDRSKKAAPDFGSLGPANITYRFRSGPNVTEANGNEVLAICPIDGNTLYCDGHVEERKGK